MQSTFTWADAWIFSALLVTRHPAGLADLVGAADGINHAIPTPEEINGALDRLHAAGLVSRSDEQLAPTPAASELFERISSGRRSLLGIVDRIHQALVRDFGMPAAPRVFSYSDADVRAAYEVYLQRLA